MSMKKTKQKERKEIEERALGTAKTDAIILDVLLDIRDLLTK